MVESTVEALAMISENLLLDYGFCHSLSMLHAGPLTPHAEYHHYE